MECESRYVFVTISCNLWSLIIFFSIERKSFPESLSLSNLALFDPGLVSISINNISESYFAQSYSADPRSLCN